MSLGIAAAIETQDDHTVAVHNGHVAGLQGDHVLALQNGSCFAGLEVYCTVLRRGDRGCCAQHDTIAVKYCKACAVLQAQNAGVR